MHQYYAVVILLVSLAMCVYLLTVLWRIHRLHSSAAWKFIFLGLSLLAVECAVGAHLAFIERVVLGVEQVIFIAVVLVKAVCYAIGFTIWKRDLEWLKTLARRRQQMDDERDKQRPGERPGEHPPAQPAPGGPPVRPQDDPEPNDPGVPDDPGKKPGGP